MTQQRHEYSHETRCRVINEWKKGVSQRAIAALLEMPHSSVVTIITFFKTHSHNVVPPRSGRPRITTARQDRRIVRAVKANRFRSAGDLAVELEKEMGKSVSRQLVYSRVHAAGMTSRSVRVVSH